MLITSKEGDTKMRSEYSFLFPKTKKARKVAIKRISVGAIVELSVNGNRYVVSERDTKYTNAWYLVDENGTRLPYSFSRDMLTVI